MIYVWGLHAHDLRVPHVRHVRPWKQHITTKSHVTHAHSSEREKTAQVWLYVIDIWGVSCLCHMWGISRKESDIPLHINWFVTVCHVLVLSDVWAMSCVWHMWGMSHRWHANEVCLLCMRHVMHMAHVRHVVHMAHVRRVMHMAHVYGISVIYEAFHLCAKCEACDAYGTRVR